MARNSAVSAFYNLQHPIIFHIARLACNIHADWNAATAVGAYLAPGAQAIVAGVLAVEVAGVLVLAAVRARLGVHGGRGDQHLLLVAHRIHLRAAGPAAVHGIDGLGAGATAGHIAGQDACRRPKRTSKRRPGPGCRQSSAQTPSLTGSGSTGRPASRGPGCSRTRACPACSGSRSCAPCPPGRRRTPSWARRRGGPAARPPAGGARRRCAATACSPHPTPWSPSGCAPVRLQLGVRKLENLRRTSDSKDFA